MTETMVNNTNMLAELIETKVALAKAEMQLEWQKAEQVKKDHSKPEPEVMAPLFEALAKAQAEFSTVTATSRVTFKNVDFKFAPLSEILGAVRPALNKFGLTLTQQTKHIPFGNANGIKVVTTLLHESGVSYDIESVPVFYNVNDIKNLGAQVTYLRRYEVKTLLGIEADSEELDMDNVPNHSQSAQQTGNYDSNHNYQSNAQARTPRKPTGARYGKTAQSTSLSSSEQTSLSEVTSANKVVSDSVSQATSEAESSPQTSETATKGIKAACNDDQLIQMVARGEEAALSLGATESQLLEWSQLGESRSWIFSSRPQLCHAAAGVRLRGCGSHRLGGAHHLAGAALWAAAAAEPATALAAGRLTHGRTHERSAPAPGQRGAAAAAGTGTAGRGSAAGTAADHDLCPGGGRWLVAADREPVGRLSAPCLRADAAGHAGHHPGESGLRAGLCLVRDPLSVPGPAADAVADRHSLRHLAGGGGSVLPAAVWGRVGGGPVVFRPRHPADVCLARHHHGHHLRDLALRGAAAHSADADAGQRGGTGGTAAGRQRLADLPEGEPAPHPLGPAVWGDDHECPCGRRVRRSVGGLGGDPEPDDDAAAAGGTAQQRLQDGRGLHGRRHPGADGRADVDPQELAGTPGTGPPGRPTGVTIPHRRPQILRQAGGTSVKLSVPETWTPPLSEPLLHGTGFHLSRVLAGCWPDRAHRHPAGRRQRGGHRPGRAQARSLQAAQGHCLGNDRRHCAAHPADRLCTVAAVGPLPEGGGCVAAAVDRREAAAARGRGRTWQHRQFGQTVGGGTHCHRRGPGDEHRQRDCHCWCCTERGRTS